MSQFIFTSLNSLLTILLDTCFPSCIPTSMWDRAPTAKPHLLAMLGSLVIVAACTWRPNKTPSVCFYCAWRVKLFLCSVVCMPSGTLCSVSALSVAHGSSIMHATTNQQFVPFNPGWSSFIPCSPSIHFHSILHHISSCHPPFLWSCHRCQ
jgi:hypothetical protein